MVNGTDDPINPYLGGANLHGLGKRGSVLSSVDSVREFARRNGITSEPVVTDLAPIEPDDPTRVQQLTWSRDGKPYVELCSIQNGGHVVSQRGFRYPRILGRTSHNYDAPQAAIDFFGIPPR